LNPVDFSHAELSSGFNSDHVLTRSVRDSAAALDITAKPLLGYRYQVNRSLPSFLDCLQDPVPGLTIGVCSKTPDGEQTPQRQQHAVAQVSKLLAENGHEIVEYEYPDDLDFGSWIDVLWMFDLVDEMERRIAQVGRRPEPHELEALTHYILQRVDSCSAMEHYQARLNAHRNSVRMMKSMAGLDLILTPSTGSDPVPVGSLDSRTEAFDYDQWTAQGSAFAPFSYICNITGQPAASLPVPLADDEPPCAVQLAGHIGQDHRVLQVSAQLEQYLNWKDCHPPIWVGD
jgi:amidase